MTVVSSFGAGDMDPGRSSAQGVKMLRAFLEYAASGGTSLSIGERTGTELNDFEADIADALSARGLALEPQWGASRYRIDLVAKHPSRPGRLVLAIECDGATYHSADMARERDRLRQQYLEALGWRFHRIWSTEWFNHREAEIERAVAAYTRAVAYADLEDAGRSPSQPQDSVAPAPTAQAAPRSRSGRHPSSRPDATIDDYSVNELIDLMRWLQSDGLLRTDDDLIREGCQDLGFQRLGARIEEALRAALARSRQGSPGQGIGG
jgi:very-short-patch-repair endonuclease